MVWFVESTICALKEFAEWEETEFHAAIILKGISRQASTGYTTSCSNRRVCSQAEARLYTLGRKGKKCLRGQDFHCSGSDIRLQCRLFTINACLWEWHQAFHVDSLWDNHHDHLQWLQRCGSFICILGDANFTSVAYMFYSSGSIIIVIYQLSWLHMPTAFANCYTIFRLGYWHGFLLEDGFLVVKPPLLLRGDRTIFRLFLSPAVSGQGY